MGARAGLLAGALLAGLPAAASAGGDPAERLERMVEAARGMDYQGVLVHGMASGVESMRLYHRGGKGGRYRERLVMLTGPAREMVRDGDTVRRYHPASRQVITGPRRGGTGVFKLDPDSLDSVTDHYRLADGPKGRVAGREAEAVDLRARDGQRYDYRVWHDSRTHLPLQTVVMNRDGRVMETYMLATVEVGARPSAEQLRLRVPEDASSLRRRSLDGQDRPPALAGVTLPEGFRLGAHFEGPGGGEHLFYSDGLATLSVFIERGAAGEPEGIDSDDIMRRGALHACSVRRGPYRVTLLGELPGETLKGLVRALRSAGPPGEGGS
jgi:sigma-E factor negative regulatory protein RseB